MTDREKVIKGLECCLDALVQNEHALAENGVVMSSWQDRAKRIDAIREAIAMLKAQEPIKPYEYDPVIYGSRYVCGGCRHKIWRNNNYCPNCGRKVKWDD